MAGRTLVYTLAFDRPGEDYHQQMARMLRLSLHFTDFSGDVWIFRNQQKAIFSKPPARTREIYTEVSATEWSEHMAYKYLVAAQIPQGKFDRILFLDVDHLALRNIDHLLDAKADLLYLPEYGTNVNNRAYNCFYTDEELTRLSGNGLNGGIFAAKDTILVDFMREWKRIDTGPTAREKHYSDQASLTKLVRSGKFKVAPFEPGEIQFPLLRDPNWTQHRRAALVHAAARVSAEQKLKYLLGLYAQRFLDPRAVLGLTWANG